MIGYDIYFRRTTPSGKTVVEHARVWDGERYIASQQKHAREQAERDGVPADKITSASREEYQSQ